MAIIFRYEHIPREDGTLRKAPFIPIFAHDENNRLVQIIALIDSGADNIVIPKELAEILGLKLGEEVETAGIGGKTKVRKTRMCFAVRKGREMYQITSNALVLMDENIDVPLILGRNGFFEEFEITFRQKEERIILKKIVK